MVSGALSILIDWLVSDAAIILIDWLVSVAAIILIDWLVSGAAISWIGWFVSDFDRVIGFRRGSYYDWLVSVIAKFRIVRLRLQSKKARLRAAPAKQNRFQLKQSYANR